MKRRSIYIIGFVDFDGALSFALFAVHYALVKRGAVLLG